jgi:hypothetical protein
MTVHLSDAELSQTSIMNQHRLSTVTVIIMLGALKLNVRVQLQACVCPTVRRRRLRTAFHDHAMLAPHLDLHFHLIKIKYLFVSLGPPRSSFDCRGRGVGQCII